MKAEACFKLLGRDISFFIGKEKKFGRLVQIKIDLKERLIVGIDENGYIEEYEVGDVQVTNNMSRQSSLTRQIVKKVNKNINTFKYDLTEYHKKDIIDFLNEIEIDEVKNEIIHCFEEGEILDSCNEVYKSVRNYFQDKEKADLLCGVIAYKQHDSDTAYKIFSERWLGEKNNLDYCRDFILVTDEFDNDTLCFYLLKQFFANNSRYINGRYYTNLWWKYLFYAIKYNNFDLLENMEITDQNVRVLLDSFIYVFYTYNLEHMAENLTNCFLYGNNTILQQNNEDVGNIQETIDELTLCRNYLPNTAEGYYLRFESCMHRILKAYEKDVVDISEEERSGYVYEYVKSRNYGFIIGFDFQKYFYHWDYITQNLRKRILDNIYSDKDIEEEDKIYVQFRRECTNKKIQAMEII